MGRGDPAYAPVRSGLAPRKNRPRPDGSSGSIGTIAIVQSIDSMWCGLRQKIHRGVMRNGAIDWKADMHMPAGVLPSTIQESPTAWPFGHCVRWDWSVIRTVRRFAMRVSPGLRTLRCPPPGVISVRPAAAARARRATPPPGA